ncbi:7740_t:CDS:2 [Funneliformis geosporum]|uniref:7740_t:CDS:1 n=1 Tax=Funneliformis geosporum TaxID=1117311 RepID=A0A9W4SV54_9GLOM|nr:7740_t:CDS:2 [Funneliformis geosporum]
MAYDETDTFEIPITKLQWGLRGFQIFFAFLAMATISAVIGWDNKFFSASLFSVFFLFIIVISIFFAAAMVVIPHLYITKGKFKNAARALRIPRIEFVLSAIWAVLILIVTFLLTIDAALIRKCDPLDGRYENYTSGPKNETFIKGLPNICRTQRAANAFGWFALTAWLCSLVLIANDWRKNRRPAATQGPTIFPDNKPSNDSSSTLEHSLPDTSTQPTQEIHHQKYLE